MAHIVIVGTSHISKQSMKDVKKTIENYKPDIVAVELDAHRLSALLQKKKGRVRLSDVFRVGLKGFLFALIGGYVQKKLGRLVGTSPGSDMLQAVKLAQKQKCSIALIDQDIQVTLQRFSKTLSWRERFRFLGDIVRGIFFPKSEMKRYGLSKIDLNKVPPMELVRKLTKQLKLRYPNIYNVLIRERNIFMTRQLKLLAKQHPDATIVAVIGAGHQEDIAKAISK